MNKPAHGRRKKFWKGVEVSKHVVVDLSKDREIVAIEILGAKQAFKKDASLIVSKVSSRRVRLRLGLIKGSAGDEGH